MVNTILGRAAQRATRALAAKLASSIRTKKALMELSSRKDTRAALIEAAERLLATRGFGGVTAMEITKEANAWNTSAVRYNFGSWLEALDAH